MIKYSENKQKISVFVLKKLKNIMKTVFLSAVVDNNRKMAVFLTKSGAKKIKKIAVNFNEKSQKISGFLCNISSLCILKNENAFFLILKNETAVYSHF